MTAIGSSVNKDIKAGKDIWSILPADKRPSEFAKVNAADFAEPKVMLPPIPGEGSRGTIDCPPDPVAALDPADLPK